MEAINKDRNQILDIAKGIGIIIIVIGHIFRDPVFITITYSFVLPLFIVISGYLYKDRKNFVLYYTRKYLLIWFLHLLLTVVYFAIVYQPNFSEIISTFSDHFYGPRGRLNNPIWYLPFITLALMFYSLVDKLLSKLEYKSWIKGVIALICLVIFSLKIFEGEYFWVFNVSLLSFLYLFIGEQANIVIKNAKDKYASLVTNGLLLISIGVIAMFSLILISLINSFQYNIVLNFGAMNYGNFLLYFISSVLGVLLVLSFSVVLSKIKIIDKLLAYIGIISIHILCIHYLIINFVEYIL